MLVSIATEPNRAVKFIASETRAFASIGVRATSDIRYIDARARERTRKHVYLLAMNIIDALSGCLLERNIITR